MVSGKTLEVKRKPYTSTSPNTNMEEHTSDIRNISEGDDLTAQTSEGETLDLTCESYDRINSHDPEDVTVDLTWYLTDNSGNRYLLQVTEGLKSYEWEAEYPRHKPLYNTTTEESVGYVSKVINL